MNQLWEPLPRLTWHDEPSTSDEEIISTSLRRAKILNYTKLLMSSESNRTIYWIIITLCPYLWHWKQPWGFPWGWWSCHKACYPIYVQRCWPARWRWAPRRIWGAQGRSIRQTGIHPRSTRAPRLARGSRGSAQRACSAWNERTSIHTFIQSEPQTRFPVSWLLFL